MTHDVYVAQLIEPEVVRGTRRIHEVPVAQLLVDLVRSEVELVQDPLLHEALVTGWLNDTP